MGRIIPYIMENKKCSKPPTSNGFEPQPPTLGRPVNARFMKRFSHRHSVCLCIFYHVYEGFVVLVLGGASTPFNEGTQALSFSIWNAWPGWIPIWFFRSLRYSAKAVTRGINPGFSKRRLAANCCTWALRGLITPQHIGAAHLAFHSTNFRFCWIVASDDQNFKHYINIAMRCASRVTWTLSSHPTPPHPTLQRSTAYRCQRARIYINIAMRCASRVTWTLSSHPTPPHPTPRNHDIRGKKCTKTRCAYGKKRIRKCAFTGRPSHQQTCFIFTPLWMVELPTELLGICRVHNMCMSKWSYTANPFIWNTHTMQSIGLC